MIKEQQVQLSHGKTYYLEAGQGEPLILLHGVGFFTGGDYWLKNMEELSKYYHVYAPDFVGWGDGDRLPIEYSFAYLVDFIREFQDAIGIPSAHIVGHSMGGWVAALFGYESPERVRTLTLVANGGISTRTLSTMTAFTPPSYDEIVQYIKTTTEPGSIDIEKTAQKWYERTKLPDAVEAYQNILNHMNQPLHRARYNLQRRLSKINRPTLVLWGSEDKVNDTSMGEMVQTLIPESEMVVLPYGHFLPSEGPNEFNHHVIQFIQKHVASKPTTKN